MHCTANQNIKVIVRNDYLSIVFCKNNTSPHFFYADPLLFQIFFGANIKKIRKSETLPDLLFDDFCKSVNGF